jgi:hypothetical protein
MMRNDWNILICLLREQTSNKQGLGAPDILSKVCSQPFILYYNICVKSKTGHGRIDEYGIIDFG